MARPTWAIRPKGERDADAVVALLAEIAREGTFIATEWPFDLDVRAQFMREALLSRTVVGWVAVDGRAVVGDLTVFDVEREAPLIGMMVTGTHRGRGIGRALMEHVIAWARANGKPALELKVFPHNAVALALYRATGFVETSYEPLAFPRRDGTVLDVVVMRKNLA